MVGKKLNQATKIGTQKSNREWWVDYLRVIAVFLVIPFHVIISYVANAMGPGINFLIWNEQFYKWAGILFEFFNPWHMQLLFLLAGFSMVFSLRKRTYGKFIVERILRLGVPLIFGLFLLNTIMSWFSTLFIYEEVPYLNPIYPNLPGFAQFYRNWWLGLEESIPFGIGKINVSHLWFLTVLLILSFVAGAIISGTARKGENLRYKISPITNILTHPASVIFWVSCAVLIKYIPALNTNENLSAIFSVFQWNEVLFFIYGMLLANSTQNIKKLQKNWIWMISFGAVFLMIWTFYMEEYMSFVRNMGAWLFDLGLIGLASKYLNKPTRGLKYFSKASMPVYILHLPLEIIVGYYIIRNPMNPVLEIAVLVLINAILCLGIYEIVRQINKIVPGIGYLIGIKEKQIWMKSKS
jgi:surface polysaccharide O-acyltransferase-like enzyme